MSAGSYPVCTCHTRNKAYSSLKSSEVQRPTKYTIGHSRDGTHTAAYVILLLLATTDRNSGNKLFELTWFGVWQHSQWQSFLGDCVGYHRRPVTDLTRQCIQLLYSSSYCNGYRNVSCNTQTCISSTTLLIIQTHKPLTCSNVAGQWSSWVHVCLIHPMLLDVRDRHHTFKGRWRFCVWVAGLSHTSSVVKYVAQYCAGFGLYFSPTVPFSSRCYGFNIDDVFLNNSRHT